MWSFSGGSGRYRVSQQLRGTCQSGILERRGCAESFLTKDATFSSGPASADDFGTIARIAESGSRDAIEMLLFSTRQKQQSGSGWPDMLANAIVRIPNLKLSEWANQQGIAPWSLSRGFRQVFGISPEAFRARSRARNAWNRIQSTNESLADIATRFGFADQSHSRVLGSNDATGC